MAPPLPRPAAAAAAALYLVTTSQSALPVRAATIVIGQDQGWTEGICYAPVTNVRPGDVLEFNYGAHDVHRMATYTGWAACDFGEESSTLLADIEESPFRYVVAEDDAADGGELYFACSIGAHCIGGSQRVRVVVVGDKNAGARESDPTSEVFIGTGAENCQLIQSGLGGGVEGEEFRRQNALQSECSDPELRDDGRYSVSCLSGPVTLTPGGVINEARIMHYPYPRDRRVLVGERTWEFVSGDPIPGSGGMGVEPVPINQLYVHHLSGRVVLGQGTEGVRRSEPDAPFPPPHGVLTGDEGDVMIFHIIDLRNVTLWLECVECRCKDGNGTYLDTGFGDGETGGVNCCTNCTDMTGPTLDYRMRYNVSYSDVPEDEPVQVIQMLTADISPVVGKNIEFDVPSYKFLVPSQQKDTDPFIQRLVREAPFNEMFKMEFFGADYAGPDEVQLFRCVGHLHIAAIGMWLEDAVTGETLCAGVGSYGTDPSQDKGFLTAISVEDYNVPKVFPADRPVRLVTEYNATTLHTGVMGMWFVFVSSGVNVTREDASLTVHLCVEDKCDVSLLPSAPSAAEAAEEACVDALLDSPACKFGGLCDCEEFANAPESTGCGGTYESDFGSMEVDSMCAKFCGACPTAQTAVAEARTSASTTTTKTCVDALKESPACKFGNLCDCETLVSMPESTGCGGVFSSQMGDLVINDVCASFCDACPETTSEEVIQANIVGKLEMDLELRCKYATSDCRRVLSNLYSCTEGKPRSEELDQNVEAVLMAHGRRLALEYTELGHSSLHSQSDDEPAVLPCGQPAVKEDDSKGESSANDEGADESGAITGLVVGVVLRVISLIAIVGGVMYA